MILILWCPDLPIFKLPRSNLSVFTGASARATVREVNAARRTTTGGAPPMCHGIVTVLDQEMASLIGGVASNSAAC